jgi:hypothetical protein
VAFKTVRRNGCAHSIDVVVVVVNSNTFVKKQILFHVFFLSYFL